MFKYRNVADLAVGEPLRNDDGGSIAGSNVLGIIVYKFPAKSNTFVVNEILSLIDEGVDVMIYSVGKPSEAEMDYYRSELGIIGDRIEYLSDKGLFKWSDVIDHKLPIAHTKFRKALDDCDDDEYVKKVEECSLASGYQIFSGLIDDIRRRNVTRLYSPFGNLGADICMILSHHAKIPYYFACHSNDLFNMSGYKLSKFEKASKVFTISEYNKRFIIETYGIPKNDIVVKRVNYIHKRSVPKIADLGYEYIFSAGRLMDMKGYDYSIRAFDKFNEIYPEMHYIIAGEGSNLKHLEDLVESLGLSERVHFVDYIPNLEVISYIKNSTFSILSSIVHEGDCEGVPTFFIESMANGTPCIGSNYSGIPELITDGETGFLTELRDVDDIFDKMTKLYLIMTSKLNTTISKKCRRVIKRTFDNKRNIKLFIRNIGGK